MPQAYRFGAKFATPAQTLSLAFSDGEHRASLQGEGCNDTLLAKCALRARDWPETMAEFSPVSNPQNAPNSNQALPPTGLAASFSNAAFKRILADPPDGNCYGFNYHLYVLLDPPVENDAGSG